MASSSPPRSSAQIFRELARLHVRAQRAAIAEVGGGSVRCTILTELGRAKSLSIVQLAKRLELDKGWVSRAVDKLVEDGTLLRAADRNDGRASILTLSAKGQRQHRKLEKALNDQIETVFSRLPPGERAGVAAALKLLYGAYTNGQTVRKASGGSRKRSG